MKDYDELMGTPLAPIDKLTREVKAAAGELDREQARDLVEIYYRVQEHRIALRGQARALESFNRPHDVVDHFASQMQSLERQMTGVLDVFSMASEVGRWSRDQTGVGPVIAAGLLAHIDITKAPTVGHIWRFGGQDPTIKWLSKEKSLIIVKTAHEEANGDWDLTLVKVAEVTSRKPEWLRYQTTRDDQKLTVTNLAKVISKRPWNASLKVLLWKLGDSFVKQSGRDSCFYGKLYRERKALEVQRNEAGEFAEQAAETLKERNIRDKATKECYESGMLPPGRIDLRARRWAVKIFLAHFHEVAYEEHYNERPPKPWVLEHGGHVHKIERPESI